MVTNLYYHCEVIVGVMPLLKGLPVFQKDNLNSWDAGLIMCCIFDFKLNNGLLVIHISHHCFYHSPHRFMRSFFILCDWQKLVH